MKRYSTIALAVVVAAAAGCKDNPVANPIDAPTVDALAGALTKTSLQQLETGVLAQDRAGVNDLSYYLFPEIYARDAYRIDASEPRFVSETLGGNPDPGSFSGGRGFTNYFVAIRAENTIVAALKTASTAQFSTAEINASLGFTRTLKALAYYHAIELRDTVGIPIQDDDPTVVSAIRCKTAVLAYIASLLDSANTDFTAAGGSTVLPFALTSGFGTAIAGRDYGVVKNLVLFNRGLKGKVDFYRALDRTSPQPALFNTAITELTQALGGAAAGAVPAADFKKGPYYVFSLASGDAANNISDSKVGINPKAKDSLQVGDTRASKIVTRPNGTLSGLGLSTTITYVGAIANATNQAAPVAILRDEELVLLRAQAYIEVGNFASATAAINNVRANYGLAPLAVFTTKTAAINAVLYEKRFSLLFEGPQRLVDLRGYGRLNKTFFAPEVAGDPYNAAYPIPRPELDARGLTVNPACTA